MALGALEDPERLGTVLAKSGFFADTRDAAQAVVKVLAGMELGFGPIQSMTSIFIVKGRVTVGSNLVAAAIRRHPDYEYRLLQRTADVCEVEIFRHGKSEGSVEFSMDMARRAGLASGDNWKKYPEAMLFARAITSAARYLAPDVFGAPIYTPDELDDSYGMDAEGEPTRNGAAERRPVIEDVTPTPAPRPPRPAVEPDKPEPPPEHTPAPARPAVEPERPADPEPEPTPEPTPEPEPVADPEAPLTPEQMAMLKELLARDDGAASFVRFGLIRYGVESDTDDDLGKLTQGQALDVIRNAAKRFG